MIEVFIKMGKKRCKAAACISLKSYVRHLRSRCFAPCPLASSMRHPNQKLSVVSLKRDLMARCFLVRNYCCPIKLGI